MTTEEAIKVIKEGESDFCETHTSECLGKTCNKCEGSIAYNMAIKALEKQIPKKPKQDEEYPLGRICPGCYRYLSNVQFVPSGYHYCENCGQALDWSETE